MPPDSAIPSAIPPRESSVLLGKPSRAHSSRFGTLRVPLSPPASLPSVSRFSLREHTWIHTGPSGTLKECVFGTALLRARPHLDRHDASGEGLLATAGPFTRSPRRRDALVHEFPGWQYEPCRSPVPGQQPWSSVPGMHALRSYLFLCTEARRIGRFLGDEAARPLALRRRHLLPRRNVSGSAFAVRPSTRRVLHSGTALTATSRRFGSGFPFEPRPVAQHIGFGRVRGVEASWSSGVADRATLRGSLFVGA